jgi:hypothetical protein
MSQENTPKVEKLTEERVPLKQLGRSTAEQPIPAERLRAHRAVIARELKRQKRAR